MISNIQYSQYNMWCISLYNNTNYQITTNMSVMCSNVQEINLAHLIRYYISHNALHPTTLTAVISYKYVHITKWIFP